MISAVDNESAQTILYLILKVYYVSQQLVLTPWLMQPGIIDPWIHFFKSMMDR